MATGMIEKPIPPRTLRPPRRGAHLIFRVLMVLLLIGAAGAGVMAYRLWAKMFGADGGPITSQVKHVVTAAINPRDAFPGVNTLYILGLGIDANHNSKGIMYTKNARSDTIFVVRLDLVNKRVSMLSIPRDTHVEIADGHGKDKINAAHAYGGIPLAKATVEQFLGVPIDHYLEIKMYGTRNFVDAMGGVTLDVEKDMNYDDNWGDLHIHLKKGRQHLTGEQAVGYARFRHDSESDFGRMRRQQQLVKAVAQQVMTPSAIWKLDKLIDVAMQNIDTDLSRAQLLALANLFHKIPPENIQTGSIPGYGTRENGVWYLEPYEDKKEAMVGWLLRGEDWYRNTLLTIQVHNASGVNGAGGLVRDILSDQGYHADLGANMSSRDQTYVVDRTGKGKDIAGKISQLLPNAKMETPAESGSSDSGDPDIVIYVGRDCARALTQSY